MPRGYVYKPEMVDYNSDELKPVLFYDTRTLRGITSLEILALYRVW